MFAFALFPPSAGVVWPAPPGDTLAFLAAAAGLLADFLAAGFEAAGLLTAFFSADFFTLFFLGTSSSSPFATFFFAFLGVAFLVDSLPKT